MGSRQRHCWNNTLIKSYIDEKVEILEEHGKVVFEHEQFIYEVIQHDNGGFEYSCYSFKDFISGDKLEAVSNGSVSGSARDAVYMAIGEQNEYR